MPILFDVPSPSLPSPFMPSPPRGLHETLITEALEGLLADANEPVEIRRSGLRDAEAADRIAIHLARVVERAVLSFGEKERVEKGIALARSLLDEIEKVASKAAAHEKPLAPGSVLRAVLARLPTGAPEVLTEPLIPLLDTTLLTNAPGEPRVGHQLQTEIDSADRIDVIMAFIRRSGVVPLLDALRRHCEAGKPLRVLTTTYTGSTEDKALDLLAEAGACVRISYDTTTTRLHAKGWLFFRRSGFSTAYIGSSNLTHSAQVSGLEWNIRASGARNPAIVEKVAAVFESYWNSGDFVPYDQAEFRARCEVDTRGPQLLISPIELRPEPFQERLLEQVALSREIGHHRNLLVSATGTGKTVMAAIDYARLKATLPRARLLFVAHREEILQQSLHTFRHCLRDHAFGELWVGGHKPQRFEHVFASVQSLSATGMKDLAPDHFDVVIVDEFHHAGAPTYRALLEHIRPLELLGLTATPERADGLPVLSWFDHRIAAELRLWDAIDQHRLAPFFYYGIHDGLDLREVPWRRGRGYDVEGLTNLLTANDAWARLVVAQLAAKVDDTRTMRALGFCVSIAHARFMSRVFEAVGIRARAIWADSPDAERQAALRDLAAGTLNVLFSVDLFNEGVDVPTVDTVLLLRPTDSPTLFLQQLGRGLRKSPGKSACTVLDFVGLHRSEFRFDQRFGALLGVSRKELEKQVEAGFPFLPAGCHLELDAKSAEIVLRSIRESTPSRWSAKVEELRALGRATPEISLARYLEATGLDVEEVYDGGRSWSDLKADAGFSLRAPGPQEEILRRACGRLLHVDDVARIDAFSRLLSSEAAPDPAPLAVRDARLLRMLVGALADKAVTKSTSLQDGVALIWAHPQVRSELLELLSVLRGRVQHLHLPLAGHQEVPLQVHGRYSRIEILAAFGLGSGAKVPPWQTGVYWAEAARADLLAFTLDKTSGQFSPTTRYRDYAISRDLVHWESQSVTRAQGATGQRYQRHVELGSSVQLFARLRADERAFWFLGPARYVCHEGELPMAVTWRLEHALPGDLFARFAAAVA
jgi:superfamily II DNA or RNA helicase/HKD family nuclease